MLVAGIDGTKRGWVVVTLDGDGLDAFGTPSIKAALAQLQDAVAVAIDMPVGLMDCARPGGRRCETAARAILGRRASSVFSSPCRAALDAPDYAAASAANRASSIHGLGLSKQAHAIFPKMREIDAALDPALQGRVFEVHPEVCFTQLARLEGQRIGDNKKSWAGATQRIALLEGGGVAVSALMSRTRELGAASDDIIDAAVAAWTARRRATGAAYCLPEDPDCDTRGLRMEMWV